MSIIAYIGLGLFLGVVEDVHFLCVYCHVFPEQNQGSVVIKKKGTR